MSRTRKQQRRVDHNPKTCPRCIHNRTHRHARQLAAHELPHPGPMMIDEVSELPEHVFEALRNWGKL